ncbi:MAG: dephospho-CoA kinase [Usitatibacter sp.]
MKPVIGLTGGIGSGKSTVAARLHALGAAVVDTDEISRALTGPAGGAMERLAREFGAKFVAADGSLDRAAMRSLAFEDAGARRRLESILHPAIRAAADRALEEATGPYAVLVVPLLFETRGYLDRVARTLVVDCPEELQVARTAARSGLARGEVCAIMDAQWPRWRRLQVADDVIWNGGDPEALAPQCGRIHRSYLDIGPDGASNSGFARGIAPQSGPTQRGAR